MEELVKKAVFLNSQKEVRKNDGGGAFSYR